MSDKIVPLQKNAPIPDGTAPNGFVIEALEGLLADAKSGHLRHVAGIAWASPRRYATFSVGEVEGTNVMGCCDVLKMRVFNLTQADSGEEIGS